MPPITELTRIEPVYLDRLEKQGVFTTGILLEVSETPTRRQYLADHVRADLTDVLNWRDEALMLNLAGFGSDEHQLFIQAGIEGLHDILATDLEPFRGRARPARRRSSTGPRQRISWSTPGGSRRGPSRRSSLGRPMHTLTGALASLVVGIAAALVIVAIAILPFLTPAWVGFEQGRAQAAAWTGYSEGDLRTATDAILADLVIGPPDFDVAIAGVPVLTERERGHMRDVRGVFAGFYLLAIVGAGVLVGRSCWLVGRREGRGSGGASVSPGA